ncbi:MAG: endo-1,3-alpha-glucanase family glycosylhydrolase [Thermoproteota archaeon]
MKRTLYTALILYIAFFKVTLFISPQQIVIYKATFVVSTTSDWTVLTFYNLTILSSNHSIIMGSNASQLEYFISFNQIGISKKPYDETNVTIKFNVKFSIEGVSSLLIEKGDIGNTSLKVYDENKRGVFSAFSIGHVPGDTIYLPLFEKLKQISLTRVLRNRLVLSFYYPWYGNPQNIYGSGILWHWEDIGYDSIGSSTHYPLLGPYDSQDTKVIEAHIKMAKAFGIDGFICSWWGIGTFEDNALRKILHVANKENFSITIYYEPVRELTQDQIVNELSYVLNNYSGEQSFLKINGNPILFIYAVSAYNRDPDFWKEVISKVEKKTKMDAIFIADSFDMSYSTVFDGFHTYIPIWINKHNLYDVYCNEAKLIRINEKLWAATVCPGYDDRKIRKPGTFVSREDGNYYNLTWNASIKSDPDMVLVCTFNEWHEGTTVEPSREFGFKYLQLTKHWVEKYKNVSLTQQEKPLLVFQVNGPILNNVGKGDALAANLLFTWKNLSEAFNIQFYRGNTYCLPVNESTFSLWIPLIRVNESVTLDLPFPDSGELFVKLYYYSLSGEDFVEKYRYFRVNVLTSYGSATGSGWYDAGSTATVSVSTTRVEKDPFTSYVFEGWMVDGELVSTSPTYTLTVTKPVSLKASWRTETNITAVGAIAGVILILVGITIAATFLKRKRTSSMR